MLALIVVLSVNAVYAATFGDASSRCFERDFESTYSNNANRAVLTFGLDVIYDSRAGTATSLAAKMGPLVDATNRLFVPSGIAFGDVQYKQMTAAEQPPNARSERQDIERWKGIWERSAHVRSSIADGRIAIIVADFLPSGLLGMLLGRFVNTNGGERLGWGVFLNSLGRGEVDRFTLQHELGHLLGLFHTFETYLNQFHDVCEEANDMILDTPPMDGESGNCQSLSTNPCTGARERGRYVNVMSYGQCFTGVPVTPGQFARVRCTVEQHFGHLRPLTGTRSGPVAPDPNPTAPNAPASGSPVGTPCNGIAGTCIDTNTQQCDVALVYRRCLGGNNVVCCPTSTSALPMAPMTPDAPSMPMTIPGVPTLTGVGTACLGVRGTCIDVGTMSCATGTLRNKCIGPRSVQCCPTVAAMPSQGGVVPGRNFGRCSFGVAGDCLDSSRETCRSGQFVSRKCPGLPNNILCCPDPANGMSQSDQDFNSFVGGFPADFGQMPADDPWSKWGSTFGLLRTANPEKEVDIPDFLPLPVANLTLHVGDTIQIEAGMLVENPEVFVYPTASVEHPPKDIREFVAIFSRPRPTTYDVELRQFATTTVGVFLDRGDYVVVIRGVVDGEERELVSGVFTVDVNSCAIEDPVKYDNLPYGLIRSKASCEARQGDVSHVIDDLLVCCVPEVVTTTLRKRRVGDVDTAMSTSEDARMSLSWRGFTSFMGAPMSLKSIAPSGPENLKLWSASLGELEPQEAIITVSGEDGESVQMVPPVGVPGSYMFSSNDETHETMPFSVVPLPCKREFGVDAGKAGYCLPVSAIRGSNGQMTDPALLCPTGERPQCDRLKSHTGISFACCAGYANALQKSAIYVSDPLEQGNPASRAVVTGTALIALAVL